MNIKIQNVGLIIQFKLILQVNIQNTTSALICFLANTVW